MKLREKIYDLVEPRRIDTHKARTYDSIMLLAVDLSILPLMFRTQYEIFWYFDLFSGVCFIVDYLLRWLTADFKSKHNKIVAFILYPFTPMAIIDMLSILPVFNLLGPSFKMFRVSRLLKLLRIFKVIRYYEPLAIIHRVIRKQGSVLLAVLWLALFYIFITALIMFNAEEDINPATGKLLFDNFFDAFYWAACTLTTVGYGDIYPISSIGRVISIISSIVGIAIIALPSGIITAGYMDEVKKRNEQKQEEVKTENHSS